MLQARPAEGEWSIVEVPAHLVDVDRHCLGRALAMRDDPSHLSVHFDDERWTAGPLPPTGPTKRLTG